jgi:transmembrane sensor
MTHNTHHPPTRPELDQYLAGEASPLLAMRVRAWIAADPRRAASAEALKTMDRPAAALAFADRWDAVATNILDDRSLSLRTGSAVGSRRMEDVPSRTPMRRWAPAIAGVVAVAGLWTFVSRDVESRPSTDISLAVGTVYRTASGEHKQVTVPSVGSMTLAPATTVTLTAEGVRLSGQAWFTVHPKPGRSFVVRTTSAEVRVLGTSFSVRQYDDERSSRVVVDDGKVAIAHAHARPVVLTARMLGITSDSGTMVTRDVAIPDYRDWTTGRLVFKQVPLREVVAELARAYDAEIRIADTVLAAQRVTITARVGRQTLAQVLDLITPAVEARYARTGRTYVIAAGRATPRAPRTTVPPFPETQYGR